MLDAYKELTPVIYGENAIKYLYLAPEDEGLCFYMHWHDRMEILCVTEGTMRLQLRDGQHILKRGQIAVIGPGQIHGGFSGKGGATYHTLMFDVEKFFNQTIASDKYLAPICGGRVFFSPVVEDERLFLLVEKIVGMMNSKTVYNPLFAVGAIYEMIAILYDHREEVLGIQPQPDAQYREILEYVNGHFTEDISAKLVSEKFGYNESYFCRRFREITGIKYSQYVQALRMELAQKLLREGSESVGSVAWKCGFSDVSYFTKCFKKQFGFTPTGYRGMQE